MKKVQIARYCTTVSHSITSHVGAAPRKKTNQDWSNLIYIKEYLKQLQDHLGIRDDEWHLVSRAQVINFHGSGLLKRYKSLPIILHKVYPGMQIKQRGWNDTEYAKNFLKDLQAHYSFTDDEWHNVTLKQVTDFGGTGLLRQYKSVSEAVKTLLPEVDIKGRKWQDIRNVQAYLKRLKQHYGITDDEWHLITVKQVRDFNGAGLLTRYKSLRNALQKAYPEIKIRKIPPRQNWKDLNYVRDFLTRLKTHYGVPDDDLHNISYAQIIEFNGGGLLNRYKSYSAAIRAAFPEYQACYPRIDWKDLNQLRNFLKQVQDYYSFSYDEWHLVKRSQIINLGGQGLFHQYKTISKAVQVAFPDIKFKTLRNQQWGDVDYLRNYLTQLKTHYKFTDKEWHLVTNKKVVEFNGSGMLTRYKSLKSALQVAFPHIEVSPRVNPWDDPEHIKSYVKEMEQILFIKKPEDWYRMSKSLLKKLDRKSVV